MIKNLNPALLIICLLLVSAFNPSPATLVGKWKGESEGEIGFIQFSRDGYVSFVAEDKKVGGKKYTMEGMVFDMTYETNESVTPHTMDFVIRLHEDQTEISRLQGIYKFVNDKTLIVNMNFDGDDRPEVFNPDDPNQIVLHRVK